MPQRFTRRAAAAALAALALTACDDATHPGGGVLTDEQALALGTVASDEVTAAVNALTVPTTIAPLGTTGGPCATATSPADSDGDGVPDNATYRFTAPPCRFTGFRGGTLEIVGEVRIEDPSPTAAGFGYEGTLTVLRTTFTGENARTFTVTRNGTRTLTGSVSSLGLVSDFQVVRTFTGAPDAAVDQQWTVTFTPDTPLQINQPLPSGRLEVTGTTDWTRGDENFALTVTTPTPLRYDVSCTRTPQRIRSGELRASGTLNGTAGYLRVRWGACGEDPAVEFIPEK